jgi:cell division protease FtsH
MKLNDLTKNILVWVVIAVVLLMMFSRFMPTVAEPEKVQYSTFLNDVRDGRIDSVVLRAR